MTSLMVREISTSKVLNELQSKSNLDTVKALNGKPSELTEGFTLKTSDLVGPKSDGETIDIPIISRPPNLYKQIGDSVKNSRFIKLNTCEATLWLLANHPNAYLLLSLIAIRAQRITNHPSGLQVGEALVGDYEAMGATRKKYRTALAVLVRMNYIKIIETCRNRKKSATGTATIGTRVSLLNSDIWDINIEYEGHPIGHRGATEGPPMGHDQEDMIDYDLIDLGKSGFDPKTTLRFKHKKTGSVEIFIEELKSELLREGWVSQEIYKAIHKMKASDPELSGTIKKYVTTILTNDRNQQEKEKKCQKTPKNQRYPIETSSNSKSPKDKGYYSEDDMSEAPLAKFALQNGLK